jgi:acetyl-CoA acetyltransferase
MRHRARSAIVGLGMTQMGKVFGRSATSLALEAIDRALRDAGLTKEQVDGLLICNGNRQAIGLPLHNAGGFKNLRLLNHMNAMGATPAQMVQYATMCIENDMAEFVVCVFADTPLEEGLRAGASYAKVGQARATPTGFAGLEAHYGTMNAPSSYAMVARRHMALYGTTQNQLGAIAVAQRSWATMNPMAQMREPITLQDYHASRMIAEPFHVLDCCLVSNGAVAVIVGPAERAAGLKSSPAYVWAMAQGYPGNSGRAGDQHDTHTGAAIAATTLYRQAGVGPHEVDVRSLYDCFTITVLITLEDYGFCAKGEGGPFVEDGNLGPGGSHPTNTGGGELSSFYMWGMTPLSEGVIQARGSGGERQVAKHDLVLVTGNGGILDYHAALILSPHLN